MARYRWNGFRVPSEESFMGNVGLIRWLHDFLAGVGLSSNVFPEKLVLEQ